MLARFFIDRPIFAWVISIVIIMAGTICVWILPVAQYPEIAPPTVSVTCSYPGASAQVVADTVAAPIEQQVVGVEDAIYMSSQSASDGSYTLTVTFALGTDLDMAQVLVQNRVSQAMATLPDVVKQTGVTTKKKSPNILMAVTLVAKENPETGQADYDQLYLSNYATIQVRDQLAALDGVGDVQILGQQDYSMRIWLNPDALATRGMTAGDVINALKEQNVQVAAGQIGQPPVPKGQELQLTMTTLGRLEEPEQFADIVVKTGSDGQITRIRDVADVELGAKNLNTSSRMDGKASVSLGVFQLPGSNALDVGDRVKRRMKELNERFPPGLEYEIAYDTTPFITESVHEVFKTLRDAVILVAIVVLFFLQDWKAVMLPMIDVAVSLVGTFAIMMVMGFTLNNLTLFGLVLAIGIVVDDAIVVLENIERWIAMGYKVRDATIHAMEEITGPIIAITLVLSSVFFPSAFLGGITGQFFRQFALTIAAAMLISALNAMTMTPARATSIFRDPKEGEDHTEHREALPWWGIVVLGGLLTIWIGGLIFQHESGGHGEEGPSTPYWLLTVMFLPGAIAGYFLASTVNGTLKVIFGVFNKGFDWATSAYGKGIASLMRVSTIALIVYVGLISLTAWGFTKIPVGFIPSQDKGYLLFDVQLPDAASRERTDEVVKEIEKIVLATEGVDHILAVSGQSFVQNAISSNFAGGFVVLKPFDERGTVETGANHIAQELRKKFGQIQAARVSVFGAPAVDGLGNAGGFKLMVEDRGDNGLAVLQAQADHLASTALDTKGIVMCFNNFRANTPQLYIDIDRVKCKSMGVELEQVFSALQGYMGGVYVNDFNRFGRTWQVNVQAEPSFRVSADTVRQLKVRGRNGQMVPIGTIATIEDSTGPVLINRYNGFPAATINGVNLPIISTGQVLDTLNHLADQELPTSMEAEWTEISFLQEQASQFTSFKDVLQNPISALIGAVILVYLILAAQYESWELPVTIILVVPMCVLAALGGLVVSTMMGRPMDLNIFVQIGFVVLVGLACKNAILVVEFAKDRMERDGLPLVQATVEACTTRLRPIVMTSFAFILGVAPLLFGHGAGAEMRYALGVAVFSGMIGVTFFGLIFTPLFYYVVMRLMGKGGEPADQGEAKKVIDAK
ncbi:efflux RND transporter permease subunit [Blastopirellula sp. JC732]|uniref:Efflux RND transporter permease subunit n=1 Tax=Blastopirellula sediminis TaxID=2894196 RepID=A0A9X1SHB2_9BACT|nr:efflux RND transporter permease subunit [Blastopirellula sediminis]MCC9606736.1 efflux RND transporter permease subunit [Blastopirellula sediminis]MCC9629967.1 efflux RND transporter permease subunit [Blastopirellula sediminis]